MYIPKRTKLNHFSKLTTDPLAIRDMQISKSEKKFLPAKSWVRSCNAPCSMPILPMTPPPIPNDPYRNAPLSQCPFSDFFPGLNIVSVTH